MHISATPNRMRIDSAPPPGDARSQSPALFGRNKTNPIPALPRLPPRRALRRSSRDEARGGVGRGFLLPKILAILTINHYI